LDRNLIEKSNNRANSQLFYINCRKSKSKKEIYRLYDLYLSNIRFKLQNYVGESIKALVNISNDGVSVKDKTTMLFLKNELEYIVKNILPFLKIEQL